MTNKVPLTVLLLLGFCVVAVAQDLEVAVLGGPCLSEAEAADGILHWYGLVRQHAEASRRGDRESAIELARQIVRSRCSNEHWWLKLAEELVEIGREEEAVTALHAVYNRESNAVDRQLRTLESPLHRLLESDVYRRSVLASKLAENRRALDQRRDEARAQLARGALLPNDHVAKGACPFECCGYGSWSVLEDTMLYDSPGGGHVVGRVSKGERIEALTGEVHLRPLPVRVRFAFPHGVTAEEGSIVFLLDYSGEGHGHVWMNGEVVDAAVLSVYEHCAFPGPDCWGEFVNPEDEGRQRDGVWWIQIETGDGTVGWTREAGHFSGADLCG